MGAAWLRGGLARFRGFLVVLMRGYKQVLEQVLVVLVSF